MTEPTLVERLRKAAIDDGVSEPIQPDEYGKLCTEAAGALTALQQQVDINHRAYEEAQGWVNKWAADCGRLEKQLTALAEAKRRLLHMATTNSDDYRWYKQQAQQACRAIGIESEKLDWE